ncbi:MAG: hypothetical protein ACLSCV_12340 [Acutalibacteraceae bacterium]
MAFDNKIAFQVHGKFGLMVNMWVNVTLKQNIFTKEDVQQCGQWS